MSAHPAAAFLECLFEDLASGAIELRFIEEQKNGTCDVRWFASVASLLAALPACQVQAEQDGRAVFFGVLPRKDNTSGTAANAAPGWVAWCDIDFKDTPEPEARIRVSAFPIPPSIVVHSGRGLHLYWLLKEATDSSECSTLSRRLAASLGADHCFDAARILRLPGTRNLKHLWHEGAYSWDAAGPVTRIESFNASLRYNPSDFDDLPEPAATPVQRTATKRKADIAENAPPIIASLLERSARLADLHAGRGKTAGDVSNSGYDLSYAMALVTRGIRDADILDAAVAARPRTDRKARTPREVRRTVDEALRRVACDDARQAEASSSATDLPPESAPLADDVLTILASALERIKANASDKAQQAGVYVELSDPAFIEAAAIFHDRGQLLVALRSLQCHGFTTDAKRIEKEVERRRVKRQEDSEAQRLKLEARQKAEAAKAQREQTIAAALTEEWPFARRGAHPAVLSSLDLSKDGRPRPGASNVYVVLSDDPRFGQRLRLNRLGDVLEFEGAPAPAEGQFTMDIVRRLAEDYSLQATPEQVRHSLWAVAERNHYHPVREYLDGLSWDGTPRLAEVLPRSLKCLSTRIHQRYIRCFAIGAVARIYRPGCKVRSALVLIGEQFAGKSTFFESWFSPPWFGDSPLPIGDKDAAMLVRSVWGYEAAELNSFERATVEAVKSFMTTGTDRYRAPYDKAPRAHPRQSVMCATTNKRQFLNDPTGSSRFHPIEILSGTEIDHEWVRIHRDQLWAEARAAFVAGEAWYLDREADAERASTSKEFETPDIWKDIVLDWMEARFNGAVASATPIPTAELLEKALSIKPDRQTAREQARIRDILTSENYIYTGARVRRGYAEKTVRGWLPRERLRRDPCVEGRHSGGAELDADPSEVVY